MASPDLADPCHYPLQFDFDAEELAFVRMSADCYRRSSFLDHRTQTAGDGEIRIPLGDLPAPGFLQQPRPPLHFIFHIAFCCSTLLARAIEFAARALVLKEPLAFTQMAYRQAGLSDSALARSRWGQRFDVLMELYSRTYPDQQAVVIKAHDRCTSLGSAALGRDPRSKAVVLYNDLRSFLLANARDEKNRLEYICRMFDVCMPADRKDRAEYHDGGLGRLRRAAALWRYRMELYARLIAEFGRKRVVPLDSAELLAAPEECLHRVLEFYGLDADEGALRELAESEVFSQHAKDPQAAYTPAQRQQELEATQRRWAGELDDVIAWCGRATQETPWIVATDSAFGDTLQFRSS